MITVYYFVEYLFNILFFAILARAILSWFRIGPENRLVAVLYELTEPMLRPLRQLIPPLGGMLDITPIIAMFLLRFLQSLILSGLSAY